MDRFSQCLAETLRWEGQYSDDKYDPGGKTMRGIIQKEYDSYRASKGQPAQWVKLISDAELHDIYFRSYWAPSRAAEVFPGLDLELFDEAVNSGPVTAVRHLQNCLGMTADGHIGMQTLDAVRKVNDREALIEAYMERRRAYLKSLKTFWRFGKGWMDRCDGVEHAARSATGSVFAMVARDVPVPHEDADTQSAGQGRAPAEIQAPPAATEATVGVGGLGGLAAAAPGIVERSTIGGKFNAYACLAAVLSEPLFWVAATALVGSLMFYLHRRRAAA